MKDHGLARALTLIEAFLEMNDSYFIQRRHSFEIILTSLSQIVHFAGTGATITRTQLNQLDKSQANQNAFDEVAEYYRRQEAQS